MKVGDLRREYSGDPLDPAELESNPLVQFRRWLDDAVFAAVPDATAMTLATAGRDGRPNARIVLLKEVDAKGFIFYSDSRSPKGSELTENPRAALVFLWKPLDRQVRVTGRVEAVDRARTEAYFRSRPRGSQLGAWASTQSAELADRATLERQVAKVAAEFAAKEVRVPPHWTGYRVLPDEVEFWQGRADRLHDRAQYTRVADAGPEFWRRVRLSP